MIRKAATSLRLSTRVAELCHSEKPHTTRFGHATIVQRLTSSLVNPSPASREATSAAVADGGGSTGSGYTPIPACLTTTSTTGPKKTADHATRAATSAPSNGAGKAGSTARIIGVSEADAAGGGGSGGGGAGNSSNRCYYWASDDAEQARTGRFVAEPGPPQTTEVGRDASRVKWRGCCCWCGSMLLLVEVVIFIVACCPMDYVPVHGQLLIGGCRVQSPPFLVCQAMSSMI